MDSSALHSLLFMLFTTFSYVLAGMDSCYDEEGVPSRCLPKFENAAFNRTVIVSNVCGIPSEDYCMQTGSTRSCHFCDALDLELNHNATYLTDFHTDEEPTWWQSQSMFYGVQYPNSVNITLHLGKAFEITYVRLKFYTSRPESFAIYKRTEENGPWQPYQYYSASCRKMYRRDNKGFIRPGENEMTALCTDEFSDISPLTGGNVAFSTLEGRPSAYNFDQSPVLQDWVTATDILISLDRLNTFGDEFFKDPKVLRSYFYAISDFSVGGSGLADECVFDAEQYRSTGSGGRCVGCRENTVGPHYPDGWKGVFSGGYEQSLIWKEGEVYLLPYREENGFYKAPDKYLGNRLLSYGRTLSLSFTAELEELLPRSVTVTLEGFGILVTADLYSQQKTYSSLEKTPINIFTLRLTEKSVKPSIAPFEFLRMLYSLTALHISNAGGQNYTSQISRVSLESAVRKNDIMAPHASWVEECTCPTGFTGQFCERCAPGFTRETPNGGTFSPCVPCNCNQHGTCHAETGVCDCRDFTTGRYCDLCEDGYYGNALTGSPIDCTPCPCPDRTTCAQVLETGDVVCTSCPAGQRGVRCELCEDGFYGNPLGWGGKVQPCVRCECNGNVDPNAVGVCDHMTGRCLKCLGHTTGDHCEKCRSGYYGNALANELNPERKCKPCACNVAGTSGSLNDCHPDTGKCVCLSHVTGRDCGQCETGYFNLQPGLGCEMCNCNPIGSSSSACHPITGQCMCRTGVEGLSCDTCRMGFFGFSSRGCRACNCDPMGSTLMQCHDNGTCSCRHGFVGYKCDKCELNHFQNRLTHQCEECPVCYSLIRDQVNKLKARLKELEMLLSSYDCNRYSRHYRRRQQQHNSLDNHIQKDQVEDYLPNALEDLLAIQEAREAFIKQFSQLETSAQTLQLQLRSIATALNCNLTDSGEDTEEGKTLKGENECQELVDTISSALNMQDQLQKLTLELNSMVMPSVIPKEPNKWNAIVNESEVLVKSHTDMAAHIEQIAEDAFKMTNGIYSLLITLLEDNSTESYVQDLTQKLAEMQQLKENLTLEVNETLVTHLSLQRHNSEIAAILENITASLSELRRTDGNFTLTAQESNITAFSQMLNQTNVTATQDPEITESEDLMNRTTELDISVQSKEHLINKTREEIQPHVDSAEKHLKTVQELKQFTAVAEGFKVSAVSSVVTGKEVEAEILSLQKGLEDMEQDWPQLPTYSKGYLKREKMLKEKTLVDVKKRIKQTERTIKPAVENATAASSTAKQAQDTADAVAKDAKVSLTQGKRTKHASGQLRSVVDTTLEQLTELESQAAQKQETMEAEEDIQLSSKNVIDSMETAKSQLESFTSMLSLLLKQLDANEVLENYDRILNETAARLRVLRGAVEGPSLTGKIQRLHSAAQDQEKQLQNLEQSLQEIREERDSLTDITQNLPKTCPQKGH
ncbi:laminin subunit gamma-1-like [Sinocyclocheilus grahami]|uniref:laminin subunit gamma-1-like n=1 Tax=Sinocyclocheilus grahami TaxID=75366 RepID=UPI0007ACA055|nr:PREDICTED: laminin subunit gamma-1-like [Sinocyclocheilus grahami]